MLSCKWAVSLFSLKKQNVPEHYRENGFQDSVLNLEPSLIVGFCEDQCFLKISHHGLLSNLCFHFEDALLSFWGHNDLGKTELFSLPCSRMGMILITVANSICN